MSAATLTRSQAEVLLIGDLAIKRYPSDLVHLAQREAIALRHLRAVSAVPNLVSLSARPWAAWLVMDRLDGYPVDRLLGERPDRTGAIEFGVALAGVLESLHVRGLEHNDIKPANLLVHGERVHVLDLGSAEGPGLEPLEFVSGTAAYLPRFTLLEQRRPLGRRDVAAAAQIVGELVLGRPMYQGSRDAIMQARAANDAPRLEGLDDDLRAVVRRAMAGRMAADELRRSLLALDRWEWAS